jgi:hypothetical protein
MNQTDKELRELGDWIAINIFNYIPCKGDYWNSAVNPGKFNCKPEDADCWAYEHNGGNPCGKDGKTYCSTESYDWNPTTDPAAAMMVLEKCVEKLGKDAYELVVGLHVYQADAPPLWMVCSSGRRGFQTLAETLPLAICRFAKRLFSK